MSHENTNADNRDSGSVTDGRLHGCHMRNLRRGGVGTGHLADQRPGRRLGKEADAMSKQTVVTLLELAGCIWIAAMFWWAVVS